MDLIGLASQHPTVEWPTREWPTATLPSAIEGADFDALVGLGFDDPDSPIGATNALIIQQHGRIIYEAYGHGHDKDSLHISWSVAKSITHGFIGTLVRDGLVDLDTLAAMDGWDDDNRSRINLGDLLAMRSGLEWVEDYEDDQVSSVIEMLFGQGVDDHARFASEFGLEAAPGDLWKYSSGTSNIVAAIAKRVLDIDGADSYRAVLGKRVFDPAGHDQRRAQLRQIGQLCRLLICTRDCTGLSQIRTSLPSRRNMGTPTVPA